jgi:hypothetical protein
MTLFIDLRQDEGKSFNYLRMSIQLFDELIRKTECKLRVSNFRRVLISPTERLAVTLSKTSNTS